MSQEEVTQEEVTQEVLEVVVKEKKDTTNPFNEGVTYAEFLSNVKGKVTVDSLLKKAKLDADSVAWIKKELKQYKEK